jgi:hypothetical protein
MHLLTSPLEQSRSQIPQVAACPSLGAGIFPSSFPWNRKLQSRLLGQGIDIGIALPPLAHPAGNRSLVLQMAFEFVHSSDFGGIDVSPNSAQHLIV